MQNIDLYSASSPKPLMRWILELWEEECFQKTAKNSRTRRGITQTFWQWVPRWRTSDSKCPTTICGPPMWRHCQLMAGSRTKMLSWCGPRDWWPMYHQILWSSAVLASAHHHTQFVLAVFWVSYFAGNAEALDRWDGKTKHCLISYFLSNTSAYKNSSDEIANVNFCTMTTYM